MNAKDYWNRRYTQGIYKSGYGSYGEQLDKKLEWLKGLDIKSVSEIGCGDFNFGSNLMKMYPKAIYTGNDISNVIIDRNARNFPQYTFTMEEVPQADLLLCIDVLFHVLDDKVYRKLLKQIESKWTKYLAITGYENEQETSSHLKIRKLNYKRFGGKLIRREIIEEEGRMYFYLFKNG